MACEARLGNPELEAKILQPSFHLQFYEGIIWVPYMSSIPLLTCCLSLNALTPLKVLFDVVSLREWKRSAESWNTRNIRTLRRRFITAARWWGTTLCPSLEKAGDPCLSSGYRHKCIKYSRFKYKVKYFRKSRVGAENLKCLCLAFMHEQLVMLVLLKRFSCFLSLKFNLRRSRSDRLFATHL